MCGIAGFLGDFEEDLPQKMADAMSHRGPDGSGVWTNREQGVGLAHRRLSIIDLSIEGAQPMLDSQTGCVIVFNGEIYNYRELRRDLVAEGTQFHGTSDTEVLLYLYRRDGHDMLASLKGIYAFAIWDPRDRTLFLARDEFGIKPLYYARTPRGLIFTSEIKTLLHCHDLDRSLNHRALHSYLTFQWSPGSTTAFNSVKKLEPGKAMLLRTDNRRKSGVELIKEWTHYDLPYVENPPHRDLPVEEAILGLRQQMETAVERQMVADVPVGAFLSGGLDSSAVVAMARAHTNERLQCFTMQMHDDGFKKDGFADDLPYARRVAKHLDVDLHEVKVEPEMMISRLKDMIYHLDEPQGDMAPLNVLFISQLARDHGIKVLLSGAGGDDILTGYSRHYALSLERYWAHLPKALKSYLPALTAALPQNRPLGRRLATAFRYADQSPEQRLIRYFYRTPEDMAASVYTPEMRAEISGWDVGETLEASLTRIGSNVEPINRMLYLEAKHFLADHNLNYTDKMSMAAGVEVRVPLLDRDLVQYATGLDTALKQKGKEGKWIFKKMMEKDLPHDVIYRPKTGFGVPIRHWLQSYMRPFLDEWLESKAFKERGIFDYQSVQNLLERNSKGEVDAAQPIFGIICIEGWCQLFHDQ